MNKLSRKTIETLWSEFDVPVNNLGEILESWCGWPVFADREEIWRWFDEQYAQWGGVHALMFPDEHKKLEVPCAFGTLVAEQVGDPGIYDEIAIDLIRPDGRLMQLVVAGTRSGDDPELHVYAWDGSDESATHAIYPNMETAVWW